MAEQRLPLAVLVPLLALLLWQVAFSVQVMRADPLYFAVQREVVFWSDEQYRPESQRVAELQARMQQAQALWPQQADYHALQARLQTWQGLLATSRQDANASYAAAAASMEQALRWRPANPWNLAQYAEYLATQPARSSELQAASAKAMALAPGDAALQARMQALRGR